MGLLEDTMKAGAPQSFEFYDDAQSFRKHLLVLRSLSNRYEIKQLHHVFDTISPNKGMTPVEYAQWRNDRDENLIYAVKINGEWVSVPISVEQKQKALDSYNENLEYYQNRIKTAEIAIRHFLRREEYEQAESWADTKKMSERIAKDMQVIIEKINAL